MGLPELTYVMPTNLSNRQFTTVYFNFKLTTCSKILIIVLIIRILNLDAHLFLETKKLVT